MTVKCGSSLALIVLLGTACGSAASPEPAAERDEPVASPASAPSRWTELVRPRDQALLEAPAIVRARAEARGDVASTVRARVLAVRVRPGDVVEAGTPVVDVSAPMLVEAAARHAAARRRLEVHKARRRELGELRAQGLANATQVFELDSTIAELEAERTHAEAILHAAGVPTRRFEAVARSGRITLSAPVPGVVTEVDARVGEIRDAGGPPFVRITGTAEAIVEVHTMEPWPTSQRLVFVTSDGREIDLDPIPVASVVVPEDGSRRSWYGPSGEPISLPEGLRGIARAAAPADAWEVPVHALRDDTVLRRRGESTGRVPVDVITASGATAWVRPRQSDGLREGDRVASRAPEDAPALDAGAEP